MGVHRIPWQSDSFAAPLLFRNFRLDVLLPRRQSCQSIEMEQGENDRLPQEPQTSHSFHTLKRCICKVVAPSADTCCFLSPDNLPLGVRCLFHFVCFVS